MGAMAAPGRRRLWLWLHVPIATLVTLLTAVLYLLSSDETLRPSLYRSLAAAAATAATMLPQGLRTVLGSGALMALAAAPHGALAGLVYVSSYAGTITTLKLDGSSLTTVNVEKSCGPQASWIALNKPASLLYCVDEAWDKTNGTLFAYRTSPAGTLSLIKKVGTPGGPVSTVFYGDGGKGIAVAG